MNGNVIKEDKEQMGRSRFVVFLVQYLSADLDMSRLDSSGDIQKHLGMQIRISLKVHSAIKMVRPPSVQ